MPAVESAAISAIEHDAASGRLAIQFVSGEVYAYDGVPRAVYAAMLEAPSKGSFFQERIRDLYPFVRL